MFNYIIIISKSLIDPDNIVKRIPRQTLVCAICSLFKYIFFKKTKEVVGRTRQTPEAPLYNKGPKSATLNIM